MKNLFFIFLVCFVSNIVFANANFSSDVLRNQAVQDILGAFEARDNSVITSNELLAEVQNLILNAEAHYQHIARSPFGKGERYAAAKAFCAAAQVRSNQIQARFDTDTSGSSPLELAALQQVHQPELRSAHKLLLSDYQGKILALWQNIVALEKASKSLARMQDAKPDVVKATTIDGLNSLVIKNNVDIGIIAHCAVVNSSGSAMFRSAVEQQIFIKDTIAELVKRLSSSDDLQLKIDLIKLEQSLVFCKKLSDKPVDYAKAIELQKLDTVNFTNKRTKDEWVKYFETHK